MLALLYDVHGNLPALRAVLEDAAAQGATRFLLGGDYANVENVVRVGAPLTLGVGITRDSTLDPKALQAHLSNLAQLRGVEFAPPTPADDWVTASAMLQAPQHENRIHHITGLRAYSSAEVVEIVSKLLDRRFHYVDMAPWAYKEWLIAQGGVPAIERVNIAKAALLYDYLDQTSFYRSLVRKQDRSRMNVPFKLRDESLDDAFLKGAKERGMVQLKGHRAVGGMRASIYNAMPIEGVRTLVDYMKEFEQHHG